MYQDDTKPKFRLILYLYKPLVFVRSKISLAWLMKVLDSSSVSFGYVPVVVQKAA